MTAALNCLIPSTLSRTGAGLFFQARRKFLAKAAIAATQWYGLAEQKNSGPPWTPARRIWIDKGAINTGA